MGRLFWKIFLGFWLSLVVVSVAVGFSVNLYNQARWDDLDDVAAGPRVEMALNAVAVALRHGGREAVAELFQDMPRRFRRQVLTLVGKTCSATVYQPPLCNAPERISASPCARGDCGVCCWRMAPNTCCSYRVRHVAMAHHTAIRGISRHSFYG